MSDAVVGALAAHLLGRHVVDGAHHHVAVGQLGGDEPRQAEVEDLRRVPLSVMKMLAGLMSRWMTPWACANSSPSQISMAISTCRRRLMRSGRRHAALEVLALEVLHGEVRLAVVLAEVVNRDDVAVRQLARGARLAEEPLALLGRRCRSGAEITLTATTRCEQRVEARGRRRPCRPGRAFRRARSGRWSACRGAGRSPRRGVTADDTVCRGPHKRRTEEWPGTWVPCDQDGNNAPKARQINALPVAIEEVVGAPRRVEFESVLAIAMMTASANPAPGSPWLTTIQQAEDQRRHEAGHRAADRLPVDVADAAHAKLLLAEQRAADLGAWRR